MEVYMKVKCEAGFCYGNGIFSYMKRYWIFIRGFEIRLLHLFGKLGRQGN